MTILCYHAIESGWRSPLAVTPEDFAQHCAWLARHREVVPLGQAIHHLDRRGRLPRGMVALTFDDGFGSLFSNALPVLQRYRLPATVFLVAETLTGDGRAVDWVDTAPAWPLTTLDADQVREMQRSGVDFESHSYSHHDLTTLDPQACLDDLRMSRETLEDLLGRRVGFLAYPRGRNNPMVREAAAKAGYAHSFTLPEGREPVDDHGLPRVGVFQGNSRGAVAVKCQRGYLPLRTSAAYGVARSTMSRAGTLRRSLAGRRGSAKARETSR